MLPYGVEQWVGTFTTNLFVMGSNPAWTFIILIFPGIVLTYFEHTFWSKTLKIKIKSINFDCNILLSTIISTGVLKHNIEITLYLF